jgi:hypothetical protein
VPTETVVFCFGIPENTDAILCQLARWRGYRYSGINDRKTVHTADCFSHTQKAALFNVPPHVILLYRKALTIEKQFLYQEKRIYLVKIFVFPIPVMWTVWIFSPFVKLQALKKMWNQSKSIIFESKINCQKISQRRDLENTPRIHSTTNSPKQQE